MKRRALELYALAVCFVTLVCAAVAAGIGIWDVVQISAPSFTMEPWQYERHQSDEAFARSFERRGPEHELAPEEVPARRQESYQAVLRSERRSGVQSLVMVLIVMLVDAILFASHWRLARRVAAGG